MKRNKKAVLIHLLKGARCSDMKLAKVAGVSQPTAFRIRRKFEEEGVIIRYSAIPDLAKLGYKIVGFLKVPIPDKEGQMKLSIDKHVICAYHTPQGFIVVFATFRNYTDFTEFAKKYNTDDLICSLGREPLKHVSFGNLKLKEE